MPLSQLLAENASLFESEHKWCELAHLWGKIAAQLQQKGVFMRYLYVLLALALSGPASAGYFGIGTGTATADVDTTGADRVDDEDGYLKVFGGVVINPNFNIEFGYVDFGEFSAHYASFDETDTASGTAFTVSALGRGNFTEALSGFVRFGVDFWDVEYDVDFGSFSSVNGSGSGTGNSTFLGAGIDFKLNENFTLRAEMEKYKDLAEGVAVTAEGFGSVEVEGSDVDLFGVGLIFGFN